VSRKKQNAWELAQAQAVREAVELGLDYFREQPELMLVEVHHYARKRLAGEQLLVAAFVEGYQLGRRRRDEFKRGE
jgi:hypothetical protein